MNGEMQVDALGAHGRAIASFGDIALQAVPLSRALLADGLGVLSSRFGGLLSHPADVLDPVMEQFEVELLRERFGSAVIFRDGKRQCIGYRSACVDTLLGDAGFDRDHLESLRRPAGIDERINAHPWARRYRRDYLVEQRSVAMVEAVRSQMELEGRARVHDVSVATDVRRVFLDQVGALFREHGFKRSGAGSKGAGIHYIRHSATPGSMALEFSIEVSTLPKGRLPMNVSVSMQPGVAGDTPVEIVETQARGDLWRIVEPLVPGFGRYRSALSPGAFVAQLHAYGRFLRACLPVVVAACDADNGDESE